MQERKDKILGLLWGCALGDALGMPYEFTYGRYPYTDEIQANGNLPVGQVSDDTEMMMACLTSLYENKGQWIREKIIEAYSSWACSGVFDIGVNTRSLFMNHFNVVKQYEANYQSMFQTQYRDKWSQSNGSLMRCMSLILCPKDEMRWLDDATLSNPHSTNLEASDLYFRLIYNILEGKDQNDKLSTAWSLNPAIKTCIQDALSVSSFTEPGSRNVKTSRGWVLHGLYFAFVIYNNLTKFTSMEDAAKFVIGLHLDSDTDTNAAIALSLLGCKLGYKNMMENKLTKQNLDLILQAQVQRPRIYHPKNINSIMDALLD
jgi:ADP-ribosyl-[dinitrogen reductase] hydrolase